MDHNHTFTIEDQTHAHETYDNTDSHTNIKHDHTFRDILPIYYKLAFIYLEGVSD